ncbi:hypothetical protein O982_24005 [Mycobacterium avium 10-5581]|nr:hypothetical protein O982_24005 [Mycobacterium avium 10-5581]
MVLVQGHDPMIGELADIAELQPRGRYWRVHRGTQRGQLKIGRRISIVDTLPGEHLASRLCESAIGRRP